MTKDILISLDLEMNQPSGRIIQVGAIAGRLTTGECLSRFSQHVALPDGEVVDPRITTLTGITPEQVANAAPLPSVINDLAGWLRSYADERVLNPLTWGGGDSQTLRAQAGLDDEAWFFGRRWIDVKTVYTTWRLANGHTGQGGLARALRQLDLAFEGRKHQAADDAWNTFRAYRALMLKFSLHAVLE